MPRSRPKTAESVDDQRTGDFPANRHETKVAILEEDQLVEVYFQRAHEYSLAGSIHKGRVTRVLPGMQSAFVDIGLERDTFLYERDFFEENEDYDPIPAGGEVREAREAPPERSGRRPWRPRGAPGSRRSWPAAGSWGSRSLAARAGSPHRERAR